MLRIALRRPTERGPREGAYARSFWVRDPRATVGPEPRCGDERALALRAGGRRGAFPVAVRVVERGLHLGHAAPGVRNFALTFALLPHRPLSQMLGAS